MPTKPDPKPARAQSDGVAAGKLYEKLRADFDAEQAEFRETPAAIRAKRRDRRDAWLADAPDRVRELVKKMVAEEESDG